MGEDASNDETTQGRTLPWLQDDADTWAWGLWEVDWRDVVILDPEGRYFDTYNLSEHDLSVLQNQDQLLSLLLDAQASSPSQE